MLPYSLHSTSTLQAARKKLLRSLASIGGVSGATLAKQMEWIRNHPEVLALRSDHR